MTAGNHKQKGLEDDYPFQFRLMFRKPLGVHFRFFFGKTTKKYIPSLSNLTPPSPTWFRRNVPKVKGLQNKALSHGTGCNLIYLTIHQHLWLLSAGDGRKNFTAHVVNYATKQKPNPHLRHCHIQNLRTICPRRLGNIGERVGPPKVMAATCMVFKKGPDLTDNSSSM